MAGGKESHYLNSFLQNGLVKQNDANEKKKNSSEFRFKSCKNKN